ncbi:hypothetical protein P691DRAFT_787924, partial [Macrolepiota fuliginosa MF-IS2]
MDSHAQQQRIRDIHDTILENEQDKGGIEVNWKNGIDFSVVEPDTILEVEVQVANTTTSAIALLTCRIGSKDVKEQDKLASPSSSIPTHPERLGFVSLRLRWGGTRTLALIFTELQQQRNTFIITRKVFATIGDPELHDRLKPEAPYTRHRGPKMNTSGRILPSTRPPEWSKSHWVERLPKYDVPAYVIEAAFGKQSRNAVGNIKRLMPAVFNTQSYGKWFQYLLYVEEEQMRQDLLAYAMTKVEVQSDYPRYNLNVQGLAEGRPSVLVGDYILVSRTEEADDGKERTWYEGRVHRVLLDRVSLRFRDDFTAPRGMKFDVQFLFNRISYRRMYHILQNSFDPKRLLFPGPEHIRDGRAPTAAQKENLVLFNRKLEEDDEQLGAIAAILNMVPGSVPFVVFGP